MAVRSEMALELIGFDGERLLRLANRVANDVIAGRVVGISAIPHIGDKRDDLVSAMAERGLRVAIRYDASLTNGNGDHAQSYIAKHMEHTARDFFRKKSEGFGDRRYGNHDRLVLTDVDDDPDPDVDFDKVISERKLARWQAAAEVVGMTLVEWVPVTLDRAAAQIERTQAA